MNVLTIGTFAVPHMGHAAFLARCAAFGDLVVGVNSDAFAQQYRGKRPLFRQEERMALIASLGYPVLLNDGPGRDLITGVRPGLLIVGTDWARKDYYAQIAMSQDELDALGIALMYLPMRPGGISATEIITRLDTDR